MRILLFVSVLLLVSVTLIGCNPSNSPSSDGSQDAGNATTTEASAQTVNEVCPMMGGKVTDDGEHKKARRGREREREIERERERGGGMRRRAAR